MSIRGTGSSESTPRILISIRARLGAARSSACKYVETALALAACTLVGWLGMAANRRAAAVESSWSLVQPRRTLFGSLQGRARSGHGDTQSVRARSLRSTLPTRKTRTATDFARFSSPRQSVLPQRKQQKSQWRQRKPNLG